VNVTLYNLVNLSLDASQDDSLSLFSGMKHLDLGGDNLRGPVPTWLAALTSLNYL
jgi:hypothetical protein